MKKCFVTKLDGVIENKDLPILGGIRLFAELKSYSKSDYVVLSSSKEQTVKVLHNGSLFNTTNVGSSNTRVILADNGFSGEIEIIIPDKYSLIRFDFSWLPIKIKLSDFDFTTDLDYIYLNGDDIDIDAQIKCNSFSIKDYTKELDISFLQAKTIYLSNCKKAKGNLLLCVKNLKNFTGELTSVEGEIISFVEKQADNNYLDDAFFRGGNITLNGTVIGSINVNVKFNSKTSITITNNGSLPTYTLTKVDDVWSVSN